MPKSSQTKTEIINTSTLTLDFQKSDFKKLAEILQIWEYDLPKYFNKSQNANYANLHIWARMQTDQPYKLHVAKEASPRLYIGYEIGHPVEDIYYHENQLIKRRLVNFGDLEKLHCIIKVLMAHYVHKVGDFVSNDAFYLLMKTSKSYAEVLKIRPSLRTLKDTKNQDTEFHELLLKDSATRLKKIKYSERDKKAIPYDFDELPEGQITFRQLKDNDINAERFIYQENTSNKYRTKSVFHSIADQNAHETSKSVLLDQFSRGFQAHLTKLGLEAKIKQLTLKQVVSKLSKEHKLPLSDLEIHVVDQRFYPQVSLQQIIQLLNSTKYGVHFIASSEAKADQKESVLILMDYSKGDCESNGVLNSRINQDGYKIIKKAGFTNSQGFCINEKAFSEEEQKKKLTEQEFLNYEGLQVEKGEIKNEDLRRNLEICLQQLFLKDLIINPSSLRDKLPNIRILNELVFIHCYTHHGERHQFMSFLEGQTLQFENLKSEKASQMLKSMGFESLKDLISLRVQYDKYTDFAKGEIYLVLGKDFVWEIKEIDERALYSSEITKVLRTREALRKKHELELQHDNEFFSQAQIKKYNALLRRDFHGTLSYEDIIKSDARKEILDILGITNEKKLAKALGIKGKKAGFFATSQGIWFDENYLQYFVGGNKAYKLYEQKKGFQMRKILLLKGDFKPNLFFPLLNVNFVKYEGFTVLPYIFRLIKIHIEIKELSKRLS